MAYIGKNPKWNTQTNTPQSDRPANPVEGMAYYDDGTTNLKGLWIYNGSTWEFQGDAAQEKSTYAVLDAEDRSVSGFTNTAISTTNPINETASYEVTSYPAQTPLNAVPRRALNKTNVAVFQYTLAAGSVLVTVLDQAGNTLTTTVINATTDVLQQVVQFSVGPSVTSIRLQFSDAGSASDFFYDDLILDDFASPYIISGGAAANRVCYVKHVENAGVNGGTLNNSIFGAVRTLNTLEGDTSFVSLSSNKISLGAGIYDVETLSCYAAGQFSELYFFRPSDNSILIRGLTHYREDTSTVKNEYALLYGRITINTPQEFEIRQRIFPIGSPPSGSGGFPFSSDINTYAVVKITKVS